MKSYNYFVRINATDDASREQVNEILNDAMISMKNNGNSLWMELLTQFSVTDSRTGIETVYPATPETANRTDYRKS